jgi:hypothetical protein
LRKFLSLTIYDITGILFPLLSINIHDDRVLYYESTDTIFDITDITDRKAKYFVDFGSSHRKSILYLLRNSNTLSYEELINQTLSFFAENKLNALVTTFFENDRQTYNSNNIEFDILNMENMGDINILGQYDNAFYAIYIPQWSDENKKRMLHSSFLSERLKTYIPQGDDEDNPMLIILK